MNGVNDAMILRRFAQKMAATIPVARNTDDLTVGLPRVGNTAQTMSDVSSPSAPGSASQPTSAELNADALRQGLPAGSSYDSAASGATMPGRSTVNEIVQGGKADVNSALQKTLMTLGEHNITGYDALAGLGGAGLGGLGAMGLARLFQSERDKERGRTPMLAGLAGAGAGAIGLPMLLKYLASQGGAQTAAAPDAAKQIIANA